MSAAGLQRFHQIVLADIALQNELRGCLDRASFIVHVLERACERGCAVEPADLDAAFEAAARNWVARGMER
jgi:hypothetical protein